MMNPITPKLVVPTSRLSLAKIGTPAESSVISSTRPALGNVCPLLGKNASFANVVASFNRSNIPSTLPSQPTLAFFGLSGFKAAAKEIAGDIFSRSHRHRPNRRPQRRRTGENLPQRRRTGENLPQRRRTGENLPQRRRTGDNLPQRRRTGGNRQNASPQDRKKPNPHPGIPRTKFNVDVGQNTPSGADERGYRKRLEPINAHMLHKHVKRTNGHFVFGDERDAAVGYAITRQRLLKKDYKHVEVMVHGFVGGGWVSSPDNDRNGDFQVNGAQLGRYLSGQLKGEPVKPIRLMVCHGARSGLHGDPSVAQEVADITKRRVIASDNTILLMPNGQVRHTPGDKRYINPQR